jgi:Protein of unknown function (DUF2855)
MQMSESIEFVVNRSDLRERAFRRFSRQSALDLQSGQVLLAVEKFALTANNITYATQGDIAEFWRFFPTPEPGWGIVPAWGYARVIQSRNDDFGVGERVFGFLPTASHLVVQPGRTTPQGFIDASVHRSELFPIYNQYVRCKTDASHGSGADDLHAVLRPLFFTSFILDDYLADRAFNGARTVLLSSASSKTALGTAFLLRRRGDVKVVGLTSARHRDFVERTGCFDAVRSYDDADALDWESPNSFVDFSGNVAFRDGLHARLGDKLVHSLRVGATHWQDLAESGQSIGVETETFFGPAQIRKRRNDWGVAELNARYATAQASFSEVAAQWLKISYGFGLPHLAQVYRNLLEGRADPACASIVYLASSDDESDRYNMTAEEKASMSLLDRGEGAEIRA